MRCAESPARNLDRATQMIRRAVREGAQIVCLPELFRTRYFCQEEDYEQFRLAEPVPGPTSRALAQLARRHRIVLVGSVFERRSPGICHNTAIILDERGRLVGKYRKMHIPDDPLYFEKFYFTPGDLGFRSFATRRARIGVLVCWDQWYPEAARLTALQGAQILCYPTAIGWHQHEQAALGPAQVEAWMTVQRGHAIANGVFVAAPNRIGRERTVQFWGNSFVSDPFGRVLARASADREEVLLATCDLSQIEDVRLHWPFLRDRRIDAYAAITERWGD